MELTLVTAMTKNDNLQKLDKQANRSPSTCCHNITANAARANNFTNSVCGSFRDRDFGMTRPVGAFRPGVMGVGAAPDKP
ncbi:MAG: hypothetical protein KGJ60_14740, partial [Verrucomicrobiota bacterium]|nr:hypothetical protein [Verrucomicrobiota bacterium]